MDWAKEMRNDGPVMALELAELSRKTGLVVRSLDSAAVDMLFAELEKYDSHEGIVRLMAEDVIRLFMRHNPRMRSSVSLYQRHRFPAEIISHCVWLYFRFALSFRDVEEMLAMRGVALTYETVREWCLKFGQTDKPAAMLAAV
jgi:hypothetical protein